MRHYIETKVSYDKTLENGVVKQVSEQYLVDAMTFAEAEARITEQLRPYMSGDFAVSAVRKSGIAEVWHNTQGKCVDDRWFKVKMAFYTLNEKTMQEKRTNSHYLVKADTVDEAIAATKRMMNGTVSNCEIVAVAESAIVDVYEAQN